MLGLIALFTGDTRYQEIKEEVKELVEEGREISMCVFAERMERRGIEIGERRGMEIGERRGIEIGEKRGYEDKIIGLVCKKLRKSKSLEVIADEIEEERVRVEHRTGMHCIVS